jgi:hypothetical protein
MCYPNRVPDTLHNVSDENAYLVIKSIFANNAREQHSSYTYTVEPVVHTASYSTDKYNIDESFYV